MMDGYFICCFPTDICRILGSKICLEFAYCLTYSGLRHNSYQLGTGGDVVQSQLILSTAGMPDLISAGASTV